MTEPSSLPERRDPHSTGAIVRDEDIPEPRRTIRRDHRNDAAAFAAKEAIEAGDFDRHLVTLRLAINQRLKASAPAPGGDR